MISYLGKESVKEKYIARVKAHQEADEIEKGFYWEGGNGCAVGCTIEGNDHLKYEKELGIPEQIAHIEDALFEAMPNSEAKKFPLRFLEAVPVGADLSLVCAKLMVWQFEDEKYGIKHLEIIKTDAELLKVCEDVVDAYKRVIAGKKVADKEWEELYQRADKIYGAWAWAWAWAWAGAGAGAGARAGARARARAGAWAGARAWARAWAWAGAGAWADYDRFYDECIMATANKLLELLKEAKP